MSRQYPPHPLLGVGAIIFEGDTVLLVERAGEPLKGWWSIPGGLLETGEKLEDALRREVLEETGLTVEILSRFDLFERIMRDAGGRAEYHYVLVDYICRTAGGELHAGDDVSRVEWVPCAHLRDYKVTSGTIEAVERAFTHARG
ncbi:MAG: NUDIX domain-containing protein [Bryobacterales bacterium]|nr:NUDIX domain-containing protein [Bryobacterales bacterium]